VIDAYHGLSGRGPRESGCNHLEKSRYRAISQWPLSDIRRNDGSHSALTSASARALPDAYRTVECTFARDDTSLETGKQDGALREPRTDRMRGSCAPWS